MNGLGVCGIISVIIYVAIHNWTFIIIYAFFLGSYFMLSAILTPSGYMKYNTNSTKERISSWSDPDGPEIIAHRKIRISNALRLIEKINQKTGKKVTITHLACKAVGMTLKEFPDLNGHLSMGNFVPFENADIGCLVSIDDGKDLAYFCYRDAGEKSLMKIIEDAETKVKSLKIGEERRKHEKASKPFWLIPSCIAGIVIEIISYIVAALGIPLKFLNTQKFPAGGAVITNVGMTGIEMGYAPFPSIMRVGVIILLSVIRDEVTVIDGKITVEKMLTLLYTFDHRFCDGVYAGKAQNRIKEILESPEEFIDVE
ncbi:unnamed protein product [Blepharisma stoltei]|uniref:2-oxoacid dehydrogenase acyltransferase catalytic domain-containing protein n=1 Tax=Blepharisma stoltei TaxID=1481888 RepID=A0AAU9KGH6_9CILI|nr:unnamed protein product [Blepharisma stoltei]